MPLIKNNQIIEDLWLALNDDDPIPEAGDILLPLKRVLDFVAHGGRHNGRLAVQVTSDVDVDVLKPVLNRLDLITLEFPAFTDGRAYSQATQLREHLGFDGELRARGNILVDQLQLMARCGIDSFEISDDRHLKVWQESYTDVNHAYQRRSQPGSLTNIRESRAHSEE